MKKTPTGNIDGAARALHRPELPRPFNSYRWYPNTLTSPPLLTYVHPCISCFSALIKKVPKTAIVRLYPGRCYTDIDILSCIPIFRLFLPHPFSRLRHKSPTRSSTHRPTIYPHLHVYQEANRSHALTHLYTRGDADQDTFCR